MRQMATRAAQHSPSMMAVSGRRMRATITCSSVGSIPQSGRRNSMLHCGKGATLAATNLVRCTRCALVLEVRGAVRQVGKLPLASLPPDPSAARHRTNLAPRVALGAPLAAGGHSCSHACRRVFLAAAWALYAGRCSTGRPHAFLRCGNFASKINEA